MPDQVRHDEFGPFCETNHVWQFHKSGAAGQKNGQSDQKRNSVGQGTSEASSLTNPFIWHHPRIVR